MAPPKKAKSLSFLSWLLLLPIPLFWCILAERGELRFLENNLTDLRFRARGEIAAPVKLIYIDVDTRALEFMGERPWSRALFADVVNALFEAGEAKAVGIDIVFSRLSTSGLVDKTKALRGNSQLRSVLLQRPKSIVLAAQYTEGESLLRKDGAIRQLPLIRKGNLDRTKNEMPEMPDKGFILGPNGPLGRVGLIDVDVEYSGDAAPRWIPLFVHTAGPTIYHLSLQLVLQELGLDESAVRIADDHLDLVAPDGRVLRTIPLHAGQLLEVNWFSRWLNPTLNPRETMADVFGAIDAYDSAKPEEQAWARKFFAQFKDAIVLIGPTDPLLQDVTPTPLDSYPVPRVGVHGNAIKTILTGQYLQHMPRWFLWAASLGLTLFVSALAVAGGARGVLAKIFALVALGGYAGVAFYLFAQSNLVLPLAAPVGAAFTTSFVASMMQLITEEKAKGRIKGMFRTYLSPELVEQMVESGTDPQLGGHEDEITAYFSDIQGFSSFSEKLQPAELVDLMNEYLTACTDIVTAQGGTLDKYIGDAVVAMFGAPIPLPDHAYRACVATQLVHLKLGELRAKWTAEGEKWPEIVKKMQSRIGLNSGPATIGNMGSRTRFNYTMMGDNVNLAARMESGAKSWGVYTMCSEATKLACEKHGGDRVVFRALGKIVVMGRSQPVPIYEIVGLKEALPPTARECIAVFEQALARYWARDWAGALELFKQSAALEPNQPGKTPGVKTNPSLVYIEHRVPEAMEEPPPPDWDGRYVMKEK